MKSMGWMTLVATLAIVGCGGGSDPSLTCGAGTVEENGACVVADASGADTGDGGADSNSGEAAIADATDAADSGPGDTGLPFGAKTFIDCSAATPDPRCAAANPCIGPPPLFDESELPLVWKTDPGAQAQKQCADPECCDTYHLCNTTITLAVALEFGIHTAAAGTKIQISADPVWKFSFQSAYPVQCIYKYSYDLNPQFFFSCLDDTSRAGDQYYQFQVPPAGARGSYIIIKKSEGSSPCP